MEMTWMTLGVVGFALVLLCLFEWILTHVFPHEHAPVDTYIKQLREKQEQDKVQGALRAANRGYPNV